MKKVICWVSYGVVLILGVVISLYRLIPVKDTGVFLFGLMWLWLGISVAAKMIPFYVMHYKRNTQLIFSALFGGMGIASLCISLTELSKQVLPVIIMYLVFLIPMCIIRQKD